MPQGKVTRQHEDGSQFMLEMSASESNCIVELMMVATHHLPLPNYVESEAERQSYVDRQQAFVTIAAKLGFCSGSQQKLGVLAEAAASLPVMPANWDEGFQEIFRSGRKPN